MKNLSPQERSKLKDEEMATMKFEVKRFELYPEDKEKLESMSSHEEKMEFMKRIRQEHRYIELD